MDAGTLSTAMGGSLSLAKYQAYVDGFNQALLLANCTTINRAAMFCAQTGHESMGLFYMEEIASGAAYQGRADLGNTKPGFGVRYKGRGIIQCTGAVNYLAFSRWAYSKGLVSSPTHFYDHPEQVALSPWAFISASWYWTVARANLNAASDAGNVSLATSYINGGQNGEADRVARYNRARPLGSRLLPVGGDDMASVPQDEWNAVRDALLALTKPWPGGVSNIEAKSLNDPAVEAYTPLQLVLRNNVEIHQLRNEVASLRKALGK
jgi:predicted chitinase